MQLLTNFLAFSKSRSKRWWETGKPHTYALAAAALCPFADVEVVSGGFSIGSCWGQRGIALVRSPHILAGFAYSCGQA